MTGASFDVEEQEIAAIVGTNGAGKSSLARAVGGLTPASGTVRLGERDLSGLNAEGRVKAGVVYVPEGRRVFPQLTVEDNLRAGGFTRRRSHDWRRRMSELYERVPRLKERAQVRAGLLSGGEQQLLAICRALMARPSVLLMDEPSLGLAPRAIDAVADLLVDLRTAAAARRGHLRAERGVHQQARQPCMGAAAGGDPDGPVQGAGRGPRVHPGHAHGRDLRGKEPERP